MKKILIALGVLVLLFVAAAVIVPIVLKEPITKAVKEEANANLNATIDFKDVSISLIRSFPDLYVGVQELSITGKDKFEGRTLVYLKTLVLDVNLMSAFSGTPIVNEISLTDGLANVIVLEDGSANYDIVPESEGGAASEETTEPSSDGAFAVKLKRFKVDGLEVMYNDMQSGMSFSTSRIDMTLGGDFSADKTALKTSVQLQKVKLTTGGISYLNGVELGLEADVDADLANKSYTLNENEFRINGLHLSLDGNISMPNEEDINLDLTYGAAKTEFKEILSLIPAIYAKDFEDVKASGSLELNGTVKGIYNENTIPGFTANVKVGNGQFKYPDLPKSVDGIQVDLSIENTGGSTDNTVIDLKQFVFQLAGNPFEIRALVKTPVSDPNIDASFKGKIDLTSLGDAIPMEEGDKLSGTIIADAEMKGKQSDLDKRRYEDFDAKGEFILMDVVYTTAAVEVPIEIKYAQFKFAPRFLELASFDAKAGKSDFKLKGKITNYLGYALGDGTLEGNFTLNSTLIEGNELSGMTPTNPDEEPASGGEETGETESSEPVLIPKNLDVTFTTNVTKIIYDNYNFLNTKGQIVVRNGKADLRGLSFNTLGGLVAMSGYYDTQDEKKPKINYDLNAQNIIVKEAYKAFGTVRKLAPIAEKTEGKATITMNVRGTMKDGSQIDYNSLNGGGRLTSQSLKITGTEALDKIAQVVKINAFKNPEVKDVNLSFAFVDGRVSVQPFDVKIGPVSANIFGSHGFDETMDYVMATKVPTSALGSQANAVIGGLMSQANSLGASFTAGSDIKVDILIKGTFDKPKITPSFGGSSGGASPTENLKAAAEAELKKQQEELEKRAREEAARLQKQVEDRARAEAEKLRKEAEERAKKEGGNALKGLFGKPKK